ncbi:MAG TPA: universal stress protein [Bacteroidota bacterium]|nr:universal stress protein [Bacteroidota bacterium]
MYARILVPTDFSKASFAAFAPAAELARRFRAQIILLHVAEELPVQAFRIGLSQKELEERLVTQAADAMRKAARKLGVKNVELVVRSGNVQEQILKLIKQRRIDLVVMGTHGRTGLARTLVGSVTERIVRLAPCHVLTIKPSRR